MNLFEKELVLHIVQHISPFRSGTPNRALLLFFVCFGITCASAVGRHTTRIQRIRNAADFAKHSSTGGVQEAIDSLPFDGGIVVLAPGTTKITRGIEIKKPVILRGYGAGMLAGKDYSFYNPSTIKVNLVAGNALTITPPESGYLGGVVLEDFQIQGNKDFEKGRQGCGIALVGRGPATVLRSISIVRVMSRDNSDCGFLVENNTFMITLQGVQSLRNGLDGIRITSTELNGKPSQIWLHDVISDLNTRDALRIEGVTGDVSIFGGTFSDSGHDGAELLETMQGAFFTQGAHFEGNHHFGLNLKGGRGHMLVGNYIGSSEIGISLGGDGGNPSLTAVIEGNDISVNRTGIYVGSNTRKIVLGPQSTSPDSYHLKNMGSNTLFYATVPAARDVSR